MSPSLRPKSKWTQTSIQDLPTIPTIEEMTSWDKEKVVRWILQRDKGLLEGHDLKYFKQANIRGRAFLRSSYDFFRNECSLSPGASLELEELVDEVKKDNLSKKRKRDEADIAEPSISPKRHRHEDSLPPLAAKARERRKHIREMITAVSGFSDQHSSSVDPSYPLPEAVDKLSDPAFRATFLFPFVGVATPIRFKLVNGKWQYVGRMKFKDLLQKMEGVRVSENYTTTWLYGTRGYGKSHLLAALVCYLAAQDVKVVYIPDCRELVKDFIEYVRAAMLFAWADDIAALEEIMTLETEVGIRNFLRRQDNVTFVIDQMNALKVSTDNTKHVDEWLNRFAYGHNRVFSSSANYTDYLEQSIRQNSNNVLQVYGGLDKMEMEQWWKQHDKIDMGGYDRNRVEDITGSIPLLLDKCVVDGKIDLTVEELQDVYDKAVAFVQKTSEVTQGSSSRWQWYCDFVTACLCHKQVPYGLNRHLDLVDHRYFYRYRYQNNWYGGYTCGLARNAVADQLLRKGIDFANTDFLLATFIYPVEGFSYRQENRKGDEVKDT
ncbi:uncharacterized protein Z518_11269 [Rhinocladiella mackenziei CBS 650.93]|uniref:NACHT domain-containing protein n=1 Tax=Rhinocladiella mackenziei CBS 650.93 TaxID=1442369 RepID=A0A0D2I8K2_9EURO|nr:uncharacterized protein Z518_11269 [Rhinocladiella mackenziei CBS 650.93]KIW99530.1 hypothetical protein Z518_11269 [Rhinocladiella mackenziei CBS 650.93]